MSQDNLISVIQHDVSQVGIEKIAFNILRNDELLKISHFYYPYFYFKADCKMPFLYGRKSFAINAMVDACSGHAATSDLFTTERKVVPEGQLLTKKITIETAQIKAKRYLIDHLNRKFRTLGNYDILLGNEQEAYKLFWVLEYKNQSIMVDSITDEFEVLKLGKRA